MDDLQEAEANQVHEQLGTHQVGPNTGLQDPLRQLQSEYSMAEQSIIDTGDQEIQRDSPAMTHNFGP